MRQRLRAALSARRQADTTVVRSGSDRLARGLGLPAQSRGNTRDEVFENLLIILERKVVWQFQAQFANLSDDRILKQLADNLVGRPHEVRREQHATLAVRRQSARVTLFSKLVIALTRLDIGAVGWHDHAAQRDTRRL